MARQSKAISDDLYTHAKESLKEAGRNGEVGRRLQAIISAKKYGITAVAKIYSITRATLMSWIRNFEKESMQGLSIKPGRGRKSKISPEIKEDIREMIKTNPNITIDHLKLKVMEEHSINIGRSTTHRLMKRLSFSYITPRPRHYKSDKIAQENFKKKSTNKN